MKLPSDVKTTGYVAASIVLALLTSSSFLPISLADPAPARGVHVKTVVIDPGHGGKDPGCSGRNTIEKEIALSVGLKLGELIKTHHPDVKVVFTRSTDVFVPLHERAQIANKAEADLFISIHCNHIGKRSSTAFGSETYVMGLHRAQDNLDVAKRENATILMEDDYIQHYDGYDPNSPEGHIILSMYQNAHLEHSILFADFVEKQFATGLARKSRGVKQAGFLVLRNTAMPSVLVEMGFLSNDDDEIFLGNKTNHTRIAQALHNAFSQYKGNIEGHIPPAPAGNIAAPETPKATIPAGNGVRFYVQLAASRTGLSPDQQRWNLTVPVETKQEGGYHKYLAGPFADVTRANAVQKDIRAGCCKDAFVVAYKDGLRISVPEAIALAGN